jgi:hypothetical protein
MFEFKTPVKLYGNAPPDEIAARLATLTAAPFSFNRSDRMKPLRGRAVLQKGTLRWPLNQYRVSSARTLEFNIEEALGGSALVGEFRLWAALRIVVLTWLGCGMSFGVWTFIVQSIHHAPLRQLLHDLLPIAIGWGMASGYLWIVVRFGRQRDESLIRVLRVALASESGAANVLELLSPNSRKSSFIDEPPPLETK